jgi:DNA-binding CsgD family transcriptional regulator
MDEVPAQVEPQEAPAAPPTREEQIAEVLDYKKQGHDNLTIAESMGIDLAEVDALLADGLKGVLSGVGTQGKILDIARLSQMMTQVYASAAGGDHEAIGLALQLMQRRTLIEADLLPDIAALFPKFTVKELNEYGTGIPGRPAHQPTEKTIFCVEAMWMTGASEEAIAREIGISSKTLRKHYRAILDKAKVRMIAEVGYKCYSAARRGEPWAIQFILSRKGGWTERSALELTGANGEPLPSGVEFTLNFVDGPPGSLAGKVVEHDPNEILTEDVDPAQIEGPVETEPKAD